jgi:predicted ATPase
MVTLSLLRIAVVIGSNYTGESKVKRILQVMFL